MYYLIKYKYIDIDGNERVYFDGFDNSTKTVLGVGSPSDKSVCAYISKKSAADIKVLIDCQLDNLRRHRFAKKIWKAKIEKTPGHLVIDGKTEKATDNAAFRYYYSLCG